MFSFFYSYFFNRNRLGLDNNSLDVKGWCEHACPIKNLSITRETYNKIIILNVCYNITLCCSQIISFGHESFIIKRKCKYLHFIPNEKQISTLTYVHGQSNRVKSNVM